jgi:uncharacterized protein (DUF58 family)
MTRRSSGKVGAYAVLAAVSIVAAVGLAQPGIAAMGAPFALALVVGLTNARRSPPDLAVTVTASPPEVREGERAEVRVTVASGDVDGRCDVGLAVPAGLVVVDGEPSKALRLRAGTTSELLLVVEARRWGAHKLGPAAVRLREPGTLYSWEGPVGNAGLLRVRPRPAATRAVVRPASAGSASGEHTARTRAEGIEFADLRPFVPGDRIGRVNWRATARRGAMMVNDRHPDRNTDVVLFLDTFGERGLADTVRIASALADAYLARHDRVGLVTFGGVLSWVEPASGHAQRERLDEALLGAESFTSFAWKSIARVPARTLPPRGLVIAVSPLVDERTLSALASMALRRMDLSVVEVPLVAGAGFRSTWSGDVAVRLHEMQHRAVRDRFLAMGVAVVPWDQAGGIESVIRQIEEYRRRARVRIRR